MRLTGAQRITGGQSWWRGRLISVGWVRLLGLEALAVAERLEEQSTGPHELVSDLIGCVSGGPEDLSTQTGERFRDLLASKAG